MAGSNVDVAITVEGWRDLNRALKKYAPDVQKSMRKEIRQTVGKVALEAKGNASSFSKRIPAAIGVSVTNQGAAIKVRRKKAPHGSLYERGGHGDRGGFRHPLFGNRAVWYQQTAHPFIQPALDRRRDDLLRDIEAAMRRAASQLRF